MSWAQRPVIDPGNVWAIGFRDEQPWVRLLDGGLGRERDVLAPAVRLTAARDTRTVGERNIGVLAADELDPSLPLWLHIDIDVLDESECATVSYPQPDGLSWNGLETLACAVSEGRPLAGVDVACLNADLDHDGEAAKRTVALIAAVLTARGTARCAARS